MYFELSNQKLETNNGNNQLGHQMGKIACKPSQILLLTIGPVDNLLETLCTIVATHVYQNTWPVEAASNHLLII